MSNGARHALGILAGLVLTAALAALLVYGTYRLQHGYIMAMHKQDKWIGGGLLAGAAIAFALLTASRISPVGSLIGGLLLTAAGVLFFVSQKTTADLINKFPIRSQRSTLAGLEGGGVILFVGVGLLFASFFPSRWRPAYDEDEGAEYDFGLPQRTDPYGRQSTDSGVGRHAARDETIASSAYGTPQTSAYGTPQADYDTPLYEPPQEYGGRAPFTPPDDGGTQELRRPD